MLIVEVCLVLRACLVAPLIAFSHIHRKNTCINQTIKTFVLTLQSCSPLFLFSGTERYKLEVPDISFTLLLFLIESKKWLLWNNVPKNRIEKLNKQIWLTVC